MEIRTHSEEDFDIFWVKNGIKNKCPWNIWSELKWWFSIDLSVKVSLLFVQKLFSIIYWFGHWFSKGFSKNIVGHDSSSKSSVAWNRFFKLNILFSILEGNLRITKLLSLLFGKPLLKRFWLRNCELIHVVWVETGWLRSQKKYWIHEHLLVRNTDNISGRSLKHLRWRNVDILLSWYILVFGIKILPLDIILLRNTQRNLAKRIRIQILRLDALNIACVSWTLIKMYLVFFHLACFLATKHCLRRPCGECDQCNPGPRNEVSDLRTLFLFCEVTIKLYLFAICVIYSVVKVMEFFGPQVKK